MAGNNAFRCEHAIDGATSGLFKGAQSEVTKNASRALSSTVRTESNYLRAINTDGHDCAYMRNNWLRQWYRAGRPGKGRSNWTVGQAEKGAELNKKPHLDCSKAGLFFRAEGNPVGSWTAGLQGKSVGAENAVDQKR